MLNRNSLSQWLSMAPMLSVPRRVTWRVITWLLAHRNMAAVPLPENTYRSADYRMIRQVIGEADLLLLQDEAYQLLSCVRATVNTPGEIAEVGVYRGGSARLICEARGERTLYLFDSFKGLPPPERLDSLFHAGQYAASLDSVQRYLAKFTNIHIFNGFFPETSGPIVGERFSFVHLDVDLYQPTKDSLEFFYPRLNQGGMLLIHDYLWSEGIRKAVQEFFVARPEPILELTGSYCGIVKL